MRDIFAIPAALTEATMDPMYEFMDLSNQGLLAAAACIEVDDESILTPSQKVAGRNSFIDNIRNIKKDYETNWHHEGVASALEKVQTGEITRLIILEPPRHGKSEQVSRHFPAWCFGKNPDEKIIACSYDATLAAMMGLDVQRNMTTPEYKDMFDTRLASGNKDGTKHKVKETEKYFEIANGDGYYIGAGIGGPITGKGMTIGIIDDPFKNKEEAQSKVIRDKVWNWYNSTFRTRGEGKASLGGDERIIICLTPWHEDGLEGRILKAAEKTGEKWVVVRCEAVREDDVANDSVYKSTPGIIEDPREIGEALWPDKFDIEKLNIIAKSDPAVWTALYQCRPSPETGNLFKVADWQWYDKEDMPRPDSTCFTLDAAFKDLSTSSYVVLQQWAICGINRYGLRQWRGHMDYAETRELCKTVFKQYPSTITKLIEEKANGIAVISELKKLFPGIIAVCPKDSKYVRALAAEGYVSGGNVFLPRHEAWAQLLVEEAKSFPFGTHDDMVDAMVQMLLYYTYNAVTYLKRITGNAS